MRCPRCGSIKIGSNKFETVPFNQIAPGVHAMRGSGHPLIAGTAMLAWLAGHAINAVIDDYQCAECRHKFS